MARSLSLKAAVARGAALLDEKQPGWWRRIDTASLCQHGVICCVLGQLFVSNCAPGGETPYSVGVHAVLGEDHSLKDRQRHGFTLNGLPACHDPDNWAELDRLWVKAVEQRRAAAAKEGAP